MDRKDILTSIPKESTDFKICLGVLDQLFHYWITDSLVSDLDLTHPIYLRF